MHFAKWGERFPFRGFEEFFFEGFVVWDCRDVVHHFAVLIGGFRGHEAIDEPLLLVDLDQRNEFAELANRFSGNHNSLPPGISQKRGSCRRFGFQK